MRKKTKAAATASNDKYEMLIDERRQHILELVQRQGRVLVTDLSSELKISQITIRKDLDWLQSHGLVQRSHGGALRITSSALADPTLQEKQKHHHLEKQKIAAAAVTLLLAAELPGVHAGAHAPPPPQPKAAATLTPMPGCAPRWPRQRPRICRRIISNAPFSAAPANSRA